MSTLAEQKAKKLTCLLSVIRQNQALLATYGVGLANNHAFLLGLFLGLNGYKLKATQVDATLTMLVVAAGEIDEHEFAGWIRKNTVHR
jgi:death-on-curing protein